MVENDDAQWKEQERQLLRLAVDELHLGALLQSAVEFDWMAHVCDCGSGCDDCIGGVEDDE